MPIDNITIDFEGMENVQKVLNQMPKNLRRNTLLRTFRKGAKPVKEAMRRLTPEDRRAYDDKYTGASGQLKESIGEIIGRSQKNTAANLYVGARFRRGIWRDPKRGGWYFHFVSKGTKYIEPRLITERTYEQSISQAETIILDELSSEVLKTMEKTIKKYA